MLNTFFGKIKDLFPASGLGPSHIIGIDLGRSSIKIAGIKMKQPPAMSFYSVTDLTEGYNETSASETIKNVLKDNGIYSKDAVLIFTDESVIFRRAELPHMPAGEILEALRWKEKEAIPFDIKDAAIGFEILEEIRRDDGSKFMELIFVATVKDVMNKKIELLKACGLSVLAVNMSPFGIENLIKIDGSIDVSKIIMVVDVGYRRTEFSIFRNKTLEFVRSIPIGSHNITEAIAAGDLLTEAGDEVKFSKTEAEKIKRDIGIAYEEVMLSKGVTSTQVISLMRPVLEQLSKEARRSTEYFLQEYGSENDIVEAYITGGGSRMKNLDRYLTEELGMAVKRMNLPDIINTAQVIVKDEDRAVISPLVGSVLGYQRRANLLPHEYRMEKVEFIEKISLRMITVIVAVLLAVSFLFIKFRVDDYKNRLKTIPYQKNVLSSVKDLQDRVNERENLETRIEMSEVKIERIMKDLSNLIPQGVMLKNLSIDKGKMLNMKGVFYGPRASAEGVLTKFMESLEKSINFRDAQLSSVQAATDTKEEASNFDINCSLE